MIFCFFFQAEDGIRDLIVTGVQTCALPISRMTRRSEWPTITHWHQPRSIAGETSPVYAPDVSQKQSWAPSLTPDPSRTSATPSSHGNGGNNATSTFSTDSPATPRTPLTRSTASPPSTGFIFQLAARSAFTFGDAAGNYASLRTATPGSSLPSRYSRVAPPPVETNENRPARPSASTAAAVSPPPTRVYAPDVAMASPTAFVPALNSGTSVMPNGPFQTMVPAPCRCWANRSTGSTRRWPIVFQIWFAGSIAVSSMRLLPVLWPCALRKVLAIAPPMMRASTVVARLFNRPILVETLAPPMTAINGFFG